ncbi:MAG TPA: anti-sigma factor [Gemmatimonadales bacterium]|jgi:anti-sigma-K factor RskA|nr:anti-sigma factor [Gemmatimonadales bacterium]
MNAHDWYIENRAGFVARSLEPGEERTFRDHLVRCDDCSREVARLERELGWLPMGVPPMAPAPGFSRRAAADVLDRTRRWRRVVPLAAAAVLALAAGGLALTEHRQGRELLAVLEQQETRLSALEDTLSVLRQANTVLQTQISMNGHSQGGMLIFQDASSHRWGVIVHGLPPAPAGSKYQFWFITETGMVRSVEVDATMERPAFMTLPMPGVPAPVTGAALTMEPAVSRSSEPKGPMLAHVVF